MPHHYYNHSRREGRSLAGSYAPSAYPGIGPYVQPPPPIEAGLLPAFGAEAADTALAIPVAAAEAAPKAGGLLGNLGNLGNLANLEQIKGIVDRMGGIDGIVSSMGKVQKVVEGFQQMAPMVKLVMGTFGKRRAPARSPRRRTPPCISRNAKKTPVQAAPQIPGQTQNRRKSSPSSNKRRRS